tara:strand:+ start:54 stop:1043 length:990 start_codon:yes stop_codon:yes gene_type:complete
MNDKMYRQNGAFANMVPRQTVIGNQPHMLAYINPSEEQLLQEYRNDAPVLAGPDGVPSYAIFGYDSVGDMFDGGGPGKSGAQFSGGGAADLDTDGDNYISQTEYSAGKSASEANKNNSISNAYDNRNNFISGISNSVGALPRGSVVAEAARGGNMDTMKTTGIAKYLQGGGMPGAVIRGITGAAVGMGGELTPEPVQAFAGGFGKAVRGMGRELTGQGNLTAAQEQERLAKSTNSIFNQGGKPPPQDVIDAYKRQNPRAFRQAAAAAAAVPETLYYDDDPYSDQITNANPKDKVVLENGMYNFYENGQLIKQITEQEYNQLLMDPYRTA